MTVIALRPLAPAAALAVLVACATAVPRPIATSSDTVEVQILAINDFHGHLDPPAGANGRIGTSDAGGAEYLGTHLARLEATSPHTVVVSAGDNIGATPLLSGMFHDEPSIETLGAIGLDVSTVGNHEFDEGTKELVRMQRGGCHPVDGCQDGTPFRGAAFEYLSANVRVTSTGDTLFPASTVKVFDGVRIGFIGLALEGTPAIVVPTGVAGLTFVDTVTAANAAAADLGRRGVHAIVVLIHEGVRWPPGGPADCSNLAGPILPIGERLSEEIAVVVSGHSHEAYTCEVAGKLLTSAASFGRLVTDIDLSIDRATGRVVRKRAANVVVTRDVARDERATAVIERYRPVALEIGRREVGTISASLVRVPNEAGETPLGDVVADALLAAARAPEQGGAVAAFMNRGGLRADLVHPSGAGAMTPAAISYADAFMALPFGNTLIVKTMTGDAIVQMLERQFDTFGPGRHNMLQVSAGMSYAYDLDRPRGQRIERASVTIDDRVVRPDAQYRVAMSDFLWEGGEGFASGLEATDPIARGLDIDAFLAYLHAHSPIGPVPGDRIRIHR